MATYTADTPLMLEIQGQMRKVNDDLSTSLTDLNVAVGGFVESSGGAAIVSFTEAQQKWNTAMAEMQDALNRAVGGLGVITDNYDEFDRHGTRLFSGF